MNRKVIIALLSAALMFPLGIFLITVQHGLHYALISAGSGFGIELMFASIVILLGLFFGAEL